MMSNSAETSNVPLDAGRQQELRQLVIARGEREALRMTGLSRMGLYRVLAGLPVNPGTRVLVREALLRVG